MRKEAANLVQFTRNFQESGRADGDASSVLLKMITALVQLLEGWQRNISGSGGSGSGSEHNVFRYTNTVTFPQPVVDLTSQDILVESCEDGPLLSHLLLEEDDDEGRDGRVGFDSVMKKKIARIGLHAIFKMIFIDNFIHAGNSAS